MNLGYIILFLAALKALCEGAWLPVGLRGDLAPWGPPGPSPWSPSPPSSVFRRPIDAMVDLTNDLGVTILQEYSHARSNFAFSPYGLASVLVVLYEGATGDSARQIHVAAKFPWDRDITRIGFRDIHRHLRSYFSHEGYLSGITLNKDRSTLKTEYKRVLRFYGYDVDPDPPKPTVPDINQKPMEEIPIFTTPPKTTTRPSDVILVPTTIGSEVTLNSTVFSPQTLSESITEQTIDLFIKEDDAKIPGISTGTSSTTSVSSIPSLASSTETSHNPTEIPSLRIPNKNISDTSTPPNVKSTEKYSSTTFTIESTPNSLITINSASPVTDTSLKSSDQLRTKFIDSLERPTTSDATTLEQKKEVYNAMTTTVQPLSNKETSEFISNTSVAMTEGNVVSLNVEDVIHNIVTTQETLKTAIVDNGMLVPQPQLIDPLPVISPNQKKVQADERVETTIVPKVTKKTTVGKLSTYKSTETSPLQAREGEETLLATESSPPEVSTTLTQEFYINDEIKTTTTLETTTEFNTEEISNETEFQNVAEETTLENIEKTTLELGFNAKIEEVSHKTEIATEIGKETSQILTSSPKVVMVNATDQIDTVVETEHSNAEVTEFAFVKNKEEKEKFFTKAVSKNTEGSIIQALSSTKTSLLPGKESTTDYSNGVVKRSPDYFNVRTLDEYFLSSDLSNKALQPPIRELKISEQRPFYPQTLDELLLVKDGESFSDEKLKKDDFVPKTLEEFLLMRTGRDFQPNPPITFKTEVAFQKFTARRKIRTIADMLHIPAVPDLSLQLQNGMFDSHVSRKAELYRPLPRQAFLVDAAAETPVPVMTYSSVFPFAYIPRLHSTALEFPLDDERYKLLIILPIERRGLRQLTYDLNSVTLRGVLDALRPSRVRATVPTFMVEGFVILTPALQRLGIWDVFDPRRANLTAMSEDPELYVRNVEQSVTVVIRNYVEILDIQTRTMAARGVEHEFAATHPFLYFVLDSETNVSLIAGQMLDPLNSRVY